MNFYEHIKLQRIVPVEAHLHNAVAG